MEHLAVNNNIQFLNFISETGEAGRAGVVEKGGGVYIMDHLAEWMALVWLSHFTAFCCTNKQIPENSNTLPSLFKKNQIDWLIAVFVMFIVNFFHVKEQISDKYNK